MCKRSTRCGDRYFEYVFQVQSKKTKKKEKRKNKKVLTSTGVIAMAIVQYPVDKHTTKANEHRMHAEGDLVLAERSVSCSICVRQRGLPRELASMSVRYVRNLILVDLTPRLRRYDCFNQCWCKSCLCLARECPGCLQRSCKCPRLLLAATRIQRSTTLLKYMSSIERQ